MPSAKSITTQAELTRYIKAYKGACGTSPSVRISPDGTIELKPCNDADDLSEQLSPYDAYKARRNHA